MQTYTNGNGKSHSDTSSHGRGEGAHVNQPRVDQYYASEVFNERVMQQRLPKDVFRRIQQTTTFWRWRPPDPPPQQEMTHLKITRRQAHTGGMP